jgi:RNA polymerase sigma-70 factor, ECF subfamily
MLELDSRSGTGVECSLPKRGLSMMGEVVTIDALRSASRTSRETFVEATYAGLFNWFGWLTNDTEEAADLTQTVFLAFWKSLPSASGSADARLWLFGVGRNVWREHCRHKRRLRSTATEAIEDDSSQWPADDDPPVDSVAASECATQIRAAVAALPDGLREAVTLRYWQDWEYADIATLLEISQEAARQRVFQARALLRRRLRKWAPQESGERP